MIAELCGFRSRVNNSPSRYFMPQTRNLRFLALARKGPRIYPTLNLWLQRGLMTPARKTLTHAATHSHWPTPRQHWRGNRANVHSAWTRGTVLVIGRPCHLLVCQTRVGSWGRLPHGRSRWRTLFGLSPLRGRKPLEPRARSAPGARPDMPGSAQRR
jgi:hypothetical protein